MTPRNIQQHLQQTEQMKKWEAKEQPLYKRLVRQLERGT